MLNLSKVVVLFFCLVLFANLNLFAQSADINVISPEFQKIDINKDGFVSANEMQVYQGQKFQELDKDNSGTIDQKELLADKTKMFKSGNLDLGNDTKITKTEFSSQFTEYFNQMDKNKDDKISGAEYTDYWKGYVYF